MPMAELIKGLRGQKDKLVDELAGIQKGTIAASRSKLTPDEQRRWDEIMSGLSAVDARMKEFLSLEAAEIRAAGAPAPTGRDESGSPYTKRSAREGISFLRDVVYQGRDRGAAARLDEHMSVVQETMEFRAIGTGALTGLVVPQYLTDMAAPMRRAGRPLADISNRHDLPEEGMTVNISRITTGASAAVQASENAAVDETNADDTLLTVDVRTIAGSQDISRQAIDRGTGADAIIVSDLARAYNTTLDSQLINGSGTSGQHRGIRNVSGIVSVAYTDASATPQEAYPKLFDLIQQIQGGVFYGVSHLVMHPRRWWWFVAAIGTTFPLIVLNATPQGAGGMSGGTGTYEKGAAGIIAGVPVILDANIPTNLGAGTNEDLILGITAEELHLWEDPDAPMLIEADQLGAKSLSVTFVVFGYSAFTAGRYPGAHGTIGGTGLITPVFA